MLLTMRRENELHSTTSTLAPEVVSSSISIANGLTNCLSQNQDIFSIQEATRCSPLQFPQSSAAAQTSQASLTTTGFGPIGYYTTNASSAAYLHHYPMYAPPAPQIHTSLVYTTMSTITTTTSSLSSSSSMTLAPTTTVTTNSHADGNNILSHSAPIGDLDEYVDILQVQQLLLDSSAHTSAAANQPRSTSPNNSKSQNTVGKSHQSHPWPQHLQHTHCNFSKRPRLHIPKTNGHTIPGN